MCKVPRIMQKTDFLNKQSTCSKSLAYSFLIKEGETSYLWALSLIITAETKSLLNLQLTWGEWVWKEKTGFLSCYHIANQLLFLYIALSIHSLFKRKFISFLCFILTIFYFKGSETFGAHYLCLREFAHFITKFAANRFFCCS